MPRAPKIDWEPIKALFISGKTIRELAVLFDVSPLVISQRSSKDNWGVLRKAAARVNPPPKASSVPPRSANNSQANGDAVLSESQATVAPNDPNNDIAFNRAIRIKNSDNFRERIIGQADKALQTLEKANPSNVYETDRFAEALTKVERIGARAYGYDREGSQPVINIGILGTGTEYDSIS